MIYDVELKGLSKKFGPVTAVDNIDLKIKQGEIFCLVGPNAAGKTTTIKLILGILKPEKGETSIRVKGFRIPQEKKKLRRIIGYLPQRKALYDMLTARENIEFFAKAKGLSTEEARNNTNDLIKRLSLTDHQNKPNSVSQKVDHLILTKQDK